MPDPWEKQPGETERAYKAFTVYRDMDATKRSVARAYEKHTRKKLKDRRRPPRHWAEWSALHRWPMRVQAYAAHTEKLSRQGREDYHKGRLNDHLDQQERLSKELIESSIRLLKLTNARLVELEKKTSSAKVPIPPDVSRDIRTATAASDGASAARSEALGVEQLLAALEGG